MMRMPAPVAPRIASMMALAIAMPALADDRLPEVAAGRIERLADFPSNHVAARHVDVWLPDGYPDAAPYAVLYMHDGQMLFDAGRTWNDKEWRVDETVSALAASGDIRPTIVVGIWNAGQRRHAEFFPERAFDALPEAMRTLARESAHEAGRAAPVLSDAYLRFVVEELKPTIEARYAVSPAAADTVVAGSSMGGLISMYALAEYPQVFGNAICMSTHWPGVSPSDDTTVADALIAYVDRHFPPPGTHRVWFDHGTGTLDAHYPPLQARMTSSTRACPMRCGSCSRPAATDLTGAVLRHPGFRCAPSGLRFARLPGAPGSGGNAL
jgi:enterochelin esterase-like enzyme